MQKNGSKLFIVVLSLVATLAIVTAALSVFTVDHASAMTMMPGNQTNMTSGAAGGNMTNATSSTGGNTTK
jgi:hypothetical protein